jgi:hypothetical protein
LEVAKAQKLAKTQKKGKVTENYNRDHKTRQEQKDDQQPNKACKWKCWGADVAAGTHFLDYGLLEYRDKGVHSRHVYMNLHR